MDKKQDEEMTKLDMLIRGLSGQNSSDAILAQEARGQAQLVNSSLIPIECPRKELESLGFVFGDNHDDLFVNVTMPDGWTKQATEHSMWSSILDEKGRTRASVFYKAAFYDRVAHMSLNRRYSYRMDYSDDNAYFAYATATGEMIYRTEETCKRGDYAKQDSLFDEVKQWLEINYPNWQNALAYWD